MTSRHKQNFALLFFILQIYLANSIFCPEFNQGTGKNFICFFLSQGTQTYDQNKEIGKTKNARLPFISELNSMILVNGYTANNLPYPSDTWIPVNDAYNQWMQMGDARIGSCICQQYGCPEWGITLVYAQVKTNIGYVCQNGYWNPDRTSCMSCLNKCYSCADKSSCNQTCDQFFPDCDECNNTNCTKCMPGFYFQPGTKTCLKTCPTQYVGGNSPQEATCNRCDEIYPLCFSCDLIGCLVCKAGLGVYLQPETRTCQSSCPTYYIQKETPYPLCQKCDEQFDGCLICSQSKCTQCKDGYYFQPNSDQNSPSDKPVQGACIKCDETYSGCLNCNQTGCLTCQPNIGFYQQPQSLECDSTCPINHCQKEQPYPICQICNATQLNLLKFLFLLILFNYMDY